MGERQRLGVSVEKLAVTCRIVVCYKGIVEDYMNGLPVSFSGERRVKAALLGR